MIVNLRMVLASSDDMTGDVVPWECCENAPISPASMPYAWITMVGCASVPPHLTILPPQVEAALL
jgi:GDP-D-mannose dehydratase